jgi:hypothetical protein
MIAHVNEHIKRLIHVNAVVKPGYKKGCLTVLGIPFRIRKDNGNLSYRVICQCDCGYVTDFALIQIIKHTNQYCRECFYRAGTFNPGGYVHGESFSSLYGRWKGIKARCRNTNNINYYKYGGRGIKVCDKWFNSYLNFRYWAMSHGYREWLSLDRYPNNDGNYEPSNCRWATYEQQANNRRCSISERNIKQLLILKKGGYNYNQLSRATNISPLKISRALKKLLDVT